MSLSAFLVSVEKCSLTCGTRYMCHKCQKWTQIWILYIMKNKRLAWLDGSFFKQACCIHKWTPAWNHTYTSSIKQIRNYCLCKWNLQISWFNGWCSYFLLKKIPYLTLGPETSSLDCFTWFRVPQSTGVCAGNVHPY